jgi:flagellar biosynthesis/type III secretory pathway protein FliH
MNHPTPEQWTSFLYGETADPRLLQTHLDSCPDCRARVDSWRRTARALDSWKLPVVSPRAHGRRLLPWAAAASVMLAFGFGLGSLVASSRQMTRLDARFEQRLEQVRAEARQEMAAERNAIVEQAVAAARESGQEAARVEFAKWSRGLEEVRATELSEFSEALQQVDTRRLNDYAALRKELETVAVFTQKSFLAAQRQMVELAGLAEFDRTLESR